MAIEYQDATNNDGLFDILGKYFHAFEDLDTVRDSTIRQEVLDAVNQYKKKTDTTLDFDRAVTAAANAEKTWRSAGDTLASALAIDTAEILKEFVAADSDLPPKNLTEALEYLIDQMENDSESVATTVVLLSVSAASGNSSTSLSVFGGRIDHRARVMETIINEGIEILAREGGNSPTLRVRGHRAARNKLAEGWPEGSGAQITMSPLTADDSLLSNPSFDTETITDTPDDWYVDVGTIGTTVQVTDYEQQSIAISGDPLAGHYLIKFTHPVSGATYSTKPITYNASGSAVQSALRELEGLSQITVATSGASPNFTHAITFTGLAGDIDLLQIVDHTTGGTTFNVTEDTAGSDLAIKGKGLIFLSDGSQLTSIHQSVSLDPDKVYFLGLWMTTSATPTDGTIEFGITQSIGGSAIVDREGNNILTSTNLSTFTASVSQAKGMFFALPPSIQDPVHVYIKKTVAATDTNVVFDEVVLVEGTQFYAGGPYIALLDGKAPVEKDDKWTLNASNGMVGKFQKYFNQFYDMAGKGLQLPSSGSPTIADSLIA